MTISCGKQCIRIGLISDTHGLLRPEFSNIFAGVDAIFHAGDIGKPIVLQELQKIAPVTAVLGNVDIPSWFPGVEQSAIIEVAGKRVYMLHNLEELDLDPKVAGVDVVIYGHTHKPANRERKGVRYTNPGSAGAPRFGLPISVALLTVGESIAVEFHQLKKTG